MQKLVELPADASQLDTTQRVGIEMREISFTGFSFPIGEGSSWDGIIVAHFGLGTRSLKNRENANKTKEVK